MRAVPPHLLTQYLHSPPPPRHASCSAITTESDGIFLCYSAYLCSLAVHMSFKLAHKDSIQNYFTYSHTPYTVCSALLQKCSNVTQITFHRLKLMAELEYSISHSSVYVFRWQSVSGEIFVTKTFLCKTARHRQA